MEIPGEPIETREDLLTQLKSLHGVAMATKQLAVAAQVLRQIAEIQGLLKEPEPSDARLADPAERKRLICDMAGEFGMVWPKEGAK
jgi:hypothetical protein